MNTDDAKYLIDGSEVSVFQTLNPGFLVCRIYQHEDGDPICDEKPFFVSSVFDTPPLERKHEEIARLESRISELTEKRREMDQQQRTLESNAKECAAKLAKFDELKQLFQFIDGQITHYVEDDYIGPRIIPFAETAVDDHYDQRGKFKLLTLFGRANGKLDWNLSQYSDGSGSGRKVHPCCGMDQAIAKATEIINEKMLAGPNISIVEIADKLGIPIPDEYRRASRDRMRASLEDCLATKKQEAAEYESKIAALT